jgi:hypothetical protein
VLVSTAYLTWYALTRFDLGRLAARGGEGEARQQQGGQ